MGIEKIRLKTKIKKFEGKINIGQKRKQKNIRFVQG